MDPFGTLLPLVVLGGALVFAAAGLLGWLIPTYGPTLAQKTLVAIGVTQRLAVGAWRRLAGRNRRRGGAGLLTSSRLGNGPLVLADAVPFFRAWLADPKRIGAVVPSSRALAKAITAEITPAAAPILELGPGTGVFTRALIERGIPERRLALIEYSTAFAQALSARFPQAQVFCMDAARLKTIELFGEERAGAVVSGLPFLSMSPRQVMAILGGVFRHLRPDGALYLFTYSPGCPVRRKILRRLGLEAAPVGRALINVPPAVVYRVRRRPALSASSSEAA